MVACNLLQQRVRENVVPVSPLDRSFDIAPRAAMAAMVATLNSTTKSGTQGAVHGLS